jgi:hypothetical protein
VGCSNITQNILRLGLSLSHLSNGTRIKILINFVVCLTTGPQPLTQRVLHKVLSSVFSFNLQYPAISLRSSITCLRLLTLPSFYLTTVPSITCFRRQYLRRMCPTQLAFLFLLYVGYSFRAWPLAIILNFPHDRSK